MAQKLVLMVGRWTTGYSKTSGKAVLSFEFTDRDPINFAIEPEEARAIGQALIEIADREKRSPRDLN